MSYFKFLYLINYEQNNYIARLIDISFYFLLPIIIYLLIIFGKKIFTTNDNLLKIFAALLLSVFISASMYYSYPRRDAYSTNHNFNTSINDIFAVRSIAKQTNNDYIVLANQAVSVAAVKEFGFKKYYPMQNGEKVFFYPIPTSSPLYKKYLDYVDNIHSADTIKEAMEMTNVSEAYLVINKYWWSAPVIIQKAALKAVKSWTIDNGEIYIFKYVLNTE